jgi:hypothetical protein
MYREGTTLRIQTDIWALIEHIKINWMRNNNISREVLRIEQRVLKLVSNVWYENIIVV